jgi:hypothetical protein
MSFFAANPDSTAIQSAYAERDFFFIRANRMSTDIQATAGRLSNRA